MARERTDQIMKKSLTLVILTIIAFALLSGCGASPANSSDSPKLRFPDKVVARADDTELDLSKLSHENVAEAAELLRQMQELKEIDLGSDGVWMGELQAPESGTVRNLTWEDLNTLQEAAPQAKLLYRFRFCEQDFTTEDEKMDLSGCPMTDNGAAVREILPLMKNCRVLDMDSCGISNEAMAGISEEYPNIDVVWRVEYGTELSCRTDEKTLNLNTLNHKDVAGIAKQLRWLKMLETIDIGSDGAWTGNPPELTQETASVEKPEEATRDLTWEDLYTLQEVVPQAELLYRFRFYGRDFTTLDEAMDLNHSPMTDNGAAVREILPLMRNCKYLDMDSCGVPSETMAEIRDEYPDMEVVWRIWFGYDFYGSKFTCRTDIELLLDSFNAPGMTDELTKDLKYCTKVKRLDMGHNAYMHDWSFLSYMPDLEICIITVSGWTDIEMLSNLTNLEYLEICPISHGYCGTLDLSPLANLTNLEHLNLCGISYTSNWEVLKNLTKLKRLWLGYWTTYGLPEGAVEELRAALPNTEINTTELAAAFGSWKGGDGQTGPFPERYALLREQLRYDDYWNVIPLAKNDPKYDQPWYHG